MSLSSLSPLTALLPPGVSLLEGLELFFQVVQDTFTTNLVAGELDLVFEPLYNSLDCYSGGRSLGRL